MQQRLVELVSGDRTHHGDKVVVGNNTDFGVAHATESAKSLRRKRAGHRIAIPNRPGHA
jgi:hypothetical protein